MATTDNHQNQQPHRLGNLGQISTDHAKSKTVRQIAMERGDSTEDIEALAKAFTEMGASIDEAPYKGDGRTLTEITASATETLKELNGWNGLKDIGQISTNRASAFNPNGEESSDEGATSTDGLCPTCHGKRGWEAAASSTNYFWKECPSCAAAMMAF